MKIRLQPFSRLTIIFILAVTIPGIMLTYLSIQNIYNLKELTEKKVKEEEESLAIIVRTNFQQNLQQTAGIFSDGLSKIEKHNYSSLLYEDSSDFIDQTFIIERTGNFLWPAFFSGNSGITRKKKTSRFNDHIKTAENKEFIDQDFSAARSQYHTAIRYATDGADSARCWNAIGRVYIKGKNPQQALESYSTLITSHYAEVDNYGVPFVHYAIPQLLVISNESNGQWIIDQFIFTLSKIRIGAIPTTQSTTALIDEITDWTKQHVSFTRDAVSTVETLADRIKSQIAFYQANNKRIRDFVLRDRVREDIPILDGHYYIPGASKENKNPIVVRYGDSLINFSGFSIHLEGLMLQAIRIQIPESQKFEYEINIINKYADQDQNDSRLVTISEISPLAPDHSITIRLKDEKSIKKDIIRTSWIYGIAITLRLGGMILGIFLTIKDIRREKETAQLRSEFVSNVTHELKTPLTSIYMFAESILLGRVKTKTDQKEYLGIILKETDRLKRLINNILDFTKREKGKLIYHFTEVNLSEVIRSAIRDLDYWTMEKRFNVRTEIEEDIIGNADPDAIKQAVINLLSNAINYSRDRKEIVVKLWEKDRLITIEVEDKGIGIPEGQLDKIFNEFYRVDDENVTEISGTGLGLTVVKDIVQAHHGKLFVKSKINQGSTFTIVLQSLS